MLQLKTYTSKIKQVQNRVIKLNIVGNPIMRIGNSVVRKTKQDNRCATQHHETNDRLSEQLYRDETCSGHWRITGGIRHLDWL